MNRGKKSHIALRLSGERDKERQEAKQNLFVPNSACKPHDLLGRKLAIFFFYFSEKSNATSISKVKQQFEAI